MLNIDFKVSEEILARVIIYKSSMPTDFANYLWDKYKDSYRELKKRLSSHNVDANIIKEVQQQEFFIKYLQDAKDNLIRIKRGWLSNQNRIETFLKNIFKVDIDLFITGYIVSPSLNCGTNIGGDSIVWGHNKGLKNLNYDLVYLVHECLHSFFPKGNLYHAIIESIADVELAKMLNNTAESYPCHAFTKEMHDTIYPYWNLFLGKSKEQICLELEHSKREYDIEKYENERDCLESLNIFEFVKFMESKNS